MFFKPKPCTKCADKKEDAETYMLRIKQLEKEIIELKGVRLQYRIAKMYIDDDPALEELIGWEKKRVASAPSLSDGEAYSRQMAALGGFGGPLGAFMDGRQAAAQAQGLARFGQTSVNQFSILGF